MDRYNWKIYSKYIYRMLFYALKPAMKHMSRSKQTAPLIMLGNLLGRLIRRAIVNHA